MFVTTEVLNMVHTVILAKQIAILFQEYSLSLFALHTDSYIYSLSISISLDYASSSKC